MKSIISHPRTSSVLLLLFIVMGILSSPSDAAQASPYLRVFSNLQITAWNVGTYNSNVPDQYASTGPLFNDTGFVSYQGAQAQAKGRADYGSLGVYTYANPVTPNTISTGASASATFYDFITISNPLLDGQQGSLSVWVDIEGGISGTIGHPGVYGGAGWGVQFVDDYYSAVESWDYSTSSGRHTYHGFLSKNRWFVYGQPFELAIVFSASANNAGMIADYYNTMTMSLANSVIRDSSGNAVTGSTFTAMSGHDYSVPEPATMLLLALGGLVLRRR